MSRASVLSVLPSTLALLLGACAHAPSGGGGALEGRVLSIDTAPWAYDGSGVLVVDAGGRTLRVALPARWNLCKGRGLDEAGTLKPGDRVRVRGTVAADGSIDACSDAASSIERL